MATKAEIEKAQQLNREMGNSRVDKQEIRKVKYLLKRMYDTASRYNISALSFDKAIETANKHEENNLVDSFLVNVVNLTIIALENEQRHNRRILGSTGLMQRCIARERICDIGGQIEYLKQTYIIKNL